MMMMTWLADADALWGAVSLLTLIARCAHPPVRGLTLTGSLFVLCITG